MNGKMVAIFGVLIIGLAVAGASYAQWTETLTVEGYVETGELAVGFEDCETNDDGPCCGDPAGSIDPWYDKNVASTNCYLETQIGEHEEAPIYKKMVITIENAYPDYVSEVNCTVANGGTIPATAYNDTISGTITYDGKTYDLLFEIIDIKLEDGVCGIIWSVYIDLNGNGMIDEGEPCILYTGSWTGDCELLERLDPCDILYAGLGFLVLDDMPENAVITLEAEMTWAQWNV